MKIYVISRPSLVFDGINSFLNDEQLEWYRTSDASSGENIAEFAARVCYMSFADRQLTKSNKDYLSHVIDQGHESVLEHAAWTFLVTGVTRSFTHQLVRHRIGFSYSQLSQQYYDQKDCGFIEPELLVKNQAVRDIFQRVVEASKDAYIEIKNILEGEHLHGDEDKTTRRELKRYVQGTARSVLPNCVETKIVFSANSRSLRHLLKVRGGVIGDLEMRIFSAKLLEIMKEEAPNMFSEFVIASYEDGYPIVFMER